MVKTAITNLNEDVDPHDNSILIANRRLTSTDKIEVTRMPKILLEHEKCSAL